MASTFSTNLRLELIGSGEQQGTWGSTTNVNFGTLLEQAISGYEEVTIGNANYTLSANNGAADESRNAVLKIVSGATSLTATRTVQSPTIEKTYVVWNATTGGQSILFKMATGTGVTIPNGAKVILYSNGTDVVQVFSSAESVTDGDKGDITVSSTNTVWTIDNDAVTTAKIINSAVTNAKLANVATSTIKGRVSASTGVVEDLTASQARTVIGLSNTDTPTFTSVELGNTTDTTLSRSAAGVLAVEGVAVPTISSTNTLTNKRVTPRISSTTSTTSPFSWNSDNFDQFAFTALANNLTINPDSGTPTDGQKVVFRFKPNTAITLTWSTAAPGAFRAVGIVLPTGLSSGKTTYVGCVYNSADSRWDAIATVTEA